MHELEAEAHDRENDADAEPHALSHRALSAPEIAQSDDEEQRRDRQEEEAD